GRRLQAPQDPQPRFRERLGEITSRAGSQAASGLLPVASGTGGSSAARSAPGEPPDGVTRGGSDWEKRGHPLSCRSLIPPMSTRFFVTANHRGLRIYREESEPGQSRPRLALVDGVEFLDGQGSYVSQET